MNDFGTLLASVVGSGRMYRQMPMAGFTTFRVGGPADWLVETRSSDEMVAVLRLAYRAGMPVTILGGGSNVLVSDAGVRGLVVRPRAGEIRSVNDGHVSADAAVTINGLVRWTILHGVAGLESWAGTPGTVGGAVHGNAHFGGRLIGDLISAVSLAARDGARLEAPSTAMAFGYDRSRLQTSGEVVLAATFRVAAGDPAVLRAAARASLAYRKRTQPLSHASAGCVFRNPEPGHDRVPDGIPWSAGALIDRAGLKGFRVGGASVSPTHGNFIVNDGSATAKEIRCLIEHCRTTVQARFGVELRDEIVYLGEFDVDPSH